MLSFYIPGSVGNITPTIFFKLPWKIAAYSVFYVCEAGSCDIRWWYTFDLTDTLSVTTTPQTDDIVPGGGTLGVDAGESIAMEITNASSCSGLATQIYYERVFE